MVDAYDLTRQARWEVEATRRAAERYHEAAAVADPETLPSGKRLLRQVVPPLVALIDKAQHEAADELLKETPGPREAWMWPTQLLDAEALAMVTVIVAFRGALGTTARGERDGMTSLASHIATQARMELEYRTWLKGGQRDVLAAFKARYPAVSARVWSRFRRRLEAEHRLDAWATAVCLQFGAKLLALLLEAAPGVFVQVSRPIGSGRRQNFLELTDEARSMVNSLEARAAVARPFRYPMLIQPNNWRYVDEGHGRLPDPNLVAPDPGIEAQPHGHP